MITSKIKGDSYEYYVLEKIKNEYDFVWHWKNLPEYILYDLNIIRDYNIFSKYRYDIGADLVAKKDDIYYFIQCKNFKDTILMEHLAGFYFLLHEYNLNGILYYNGNLSQRVKDLSTGTIQFINFPFNNETIIPINIKEKIVAREYQLEASNKIKNYDKCILSLPCGMGKTYTASLIAKNYNNVIVIAPLRFLAQQLLFNMYNYLEMEYSPILISMDGSRNINIIKNYIKKKNIFSCTYDSVDVIIELVDNLDNIYLIIDEFHNLSYNNLNNKDDNIYKLMNKINKHLYLSATPLKDFNCDFKYEYSWQDAITNNFICNFNIILHDISNNDLFSFCYLIKKFCSSELNLNLIAKAYFIIKGMMYYGSRKCICYMTCVDKANQMSDIIYWMIKLLNINLNTWTISYKTSKNNRDKFINEFKNNLDLSILINVHILDEGIDIPECDSVFITKQNNNIINIVQRMCRSIRINNNKKISYIFMWCSKNKTEKILDYLANNTNNIIKDKIIKIAFKKNTVNSYKYMNLLENNSKINTDIDIKNKLIDFIKTKNIPENIINLYFNELYEKNENKNCIINLDTVLQIIDCRKDYIKDTLKNSYKINIDYTCNKINEVKHGGNNKEIIFLAINCFKNIMLKSRNNSAKICIAQILEIEKLINNFKDDIINNLKKINQQLLNDNRGICI